MLPMLTVSGAPGLMYLNGKFCGETGVAAMPMARDGVQYLEVRPFDADKRGAVLRLRFEDGRLVGGLSEEAYAVQWPNGWIEVELRGEDAGKTPVDAAPRLLARLDMPTGQYLLVDEGGVPSFGRDAEEAVFLPVEGAASGTLRPLPYPGLCVAEGECAAGRFAAVLRAEDTPEIVQAVSGPSVHLDGQGVLTHVEAVDDLVGHARILVFAPDARGAYSLRSRDTAWRDGGPHWPRTPEETGRAFLEALSFGAAEEAAGYLARPDQLGRFERAVGAFDSVTPLPPDGTGEPRWGVLAIGGENIAAVRRFLFQTIRRPSAQGDWKIEEITEQLCD